MQVNDFLKPYPLFSKCLSLKQLHLQKVENCQFDECTINAPAVLKVEPNTSFLDVLAELLHISNKVDTHDLWLMILVTHCLLSDSDPRICFD